jgi:phage-related minor tail protein
MVAVVVGLVVIVAVVMGLVVIVAVIVGLVVIVAVIVGLVVIVAVVVGSVVGLVVVGMIAAKSYHNFFSDFIEFVSNLGGDVLGEILGLVPE